MGTRDEVTNFNPSGIRDRYGYMLLGSRGQERERQYMSAPRLIVMSTHGPLYICCPLRDHTTQLEFQFDTQNIKISNQNVFCEFLKKCGLRGSICCLTYL